MTFFPLSCQSFIKHKKTFQQLFPDISKEEELIHCKLSHGVGGVIFKSGPINLNASPPLPAYVCALQKEVPYHGRLYVTEAHVCFYSSVLLKDTKVKPGSERPAAIHPSPFKATPPPSSLPLQVVIPLCFIHIIKKQNTALLVPTALSVRTSNGDKVRLASRKGVAEQQQTPPQHLRACLLMWLILFFFLIPFCGLVPVYVAAEQRVLLPAAAFFMSSDRGESQSQSPRQRVHNCPVLHFHS